MYYFILILIIISLIILLYIKIKYRFWIYQPVFHIYDISYMLNPPGIINDKLPLKNKYTNFTNITTSTFEEISQIKVNKFVNFIKHNYLQNGNNRFCPSNKTINSQFASHNSSSYFSFYTENIKLNFKNSNNIIKDAKILGVITSRPLNVIINSQQSVKFDLYYADYLCVDLKHRKKGIAPNLIQTHEYNQRHLNKNIKVSLFKREDKLTGIMPLCVYKTYGFHLFKWNKPHPLHSKYSMINIKKENLYKVIDFIKINISLFDIIIKPDCSNILQQIQNESMLIGVIILQDEIKCVYFFKRTHTCIEENMEILTCSASIKTPNFPNEYFIQGFKIMFWDYAEKYNYGCCVIENISQNNLLIQNICIKTKPFITSPTAYYFYNYACHPFNPEKVLIIE